MTWATSRNKLFKKNLIQPELPDNLFPDGILRVSADDPVDQLAVGEEHDSRNC